MQNIYVLYAIVDNSISQQRSQFTMLFLEILGKRCY